MLSSTLLFTLFTSMVTVSNAAPVALPKTVSFETSLHNSPALVNLMKKRGDDVVSVKTDIHQILLTFPSTIGGTDVTSVVDTGSRTSWIYNGESDSSNELCNTGSCVTSSNNLDVSDDDYSIYYRGNFGASGKWATAKLSLDGSDGVDYKFGLADTLTGETGSYSWSGFGYDSDEYESDTTTHIVDVLQAGGVIDHRIFQLSYGDIESWEDDVMGTGSLTIGDYNRTADVRFFNMTENIQYYLAIPMDGASTSTGNSIELAEDKTVVFDSGSTSLLMKQKYIDTLLADIVYDETYTDFFKCSSYADYKLSFKIDDDNTLTIPLLDISWNNYKDDYDLCQLMLGSVPDDVTFEIAFGQCYEKPHYCF